MTEQPKECKHLWIERYLEYVKKDCPCYITFGSFTNHPNSTAKDEKHHCSNIMCQKRIDLSSTECSVNCARLVHATDRVPVDEQPRHLMNATFQYEAFDTYYNTQLYVPISSGLRRILTRSFFSPRPDDTARHHQLRHNYLTASNVAAVLNMNPYCSLRSVLEKYMQPYTEGPDNYFMKQGRLMESKIADKFVRATNIPCVYNQGLTPHSKYKFLAATFDLISCDGVPIEIKYLVKRNPTEDTLMPTMYWVQCQIQMQVAESDKCFYVEYKRQTAHDSEHFNILTVRRDDEWFNQIIPVLEEFWNVVCNYRSYFGNNIL